LSIADVTLGYELRCARPIPFDIDYTRTLGHGAIRFLLSEPADERLRYGGLVCLDSGRLHVLPFDEIRDPATGRTRVRLVDVDSEYYEVAREYMIRLEPRDLQDPERLAKLAAAAMITTQEFERTFAHAAGLSDREAARSTRAAT
jgi:6-phosphofructokinase 1